MFGLKTLGIVFLASSILSGIGTYKLTTDHWQAKINVEKAKSQKKYDVAVESSIKAYLDEAHKNDELDKKQKDLEIEHSQDTTCLLSPDDASRLR